MQMAYQSIHVYTFSRDIYFQYSPQMVSNQEQSGQPLLVRTRLPLGAESFFVRQAPNHKHLREPAARGAAATTFVMTLPAPQVPALQVPSCSLATGHASERASRCSSSVGHAHSLLCWVSRVCGAYVQQATHLLGAPASGKLPIYD